MVYQYTSKSRDNYTISTINFNQVNSSKNYQVLFMISYVIKVLDNIYGYIIVNHFISKFNSGNLYLYMMRSIYCFSY